MASAESRFARRIADGEGEAEEERSLLSPTYACRIEYLDGQSNSLAV